MESSVPTVCLGGGAFGIAGSFTGGFGGGVGATLTFLLGGDEFAKTASVEQRTTGCTRTTLQNSFREGEGMYFSHALFKGTKHPR